MGPRAKNKSGVSTVVQTAIPTRVPTGSRRGPNGVPTGSQRSPSGVPTGSQRQGVATPRGPNVVPKHVDLWTFGPVDLYTFHHRPEALAGASPGTPRKCIRMGPSAFGHWKMYAQWVIVPPIRRTADV